VARGVVAEAEAGAELLAAGAGKAEAAGDRQHGRAEREGTHPAPAVAHPREAFATGGAVAIEHVVAHLTVLSIGSDRRCDDQTLAVHRFSRSGRM
jgi:hypothetical protein